MHIGAGKTMLKLTEKWDVFLSHLIWITNYQTDQDGTLTVELFWWSCFISSKKVVWNCNS